MPTSPSIARDIATGVLDLVFPPGCYLCNKPLLAGCSSSFCDACLKQLSMQRGPQCPRCAAHFPQSASTPDCHFCHDENYSFVQAHSWGAYESALRNIILRIKDQNSESLAHHIGVLYAKQFHEIISSWPIDAVIPVPLHWTRRLWRGYNQAEVLAQAVAKDLHKPCRTTWLWRRLRTPHQASVTPTQRRKNLRQAMAARIPKPCSRQHILLIDDVMTTGATADACARALLSAGAQSVRVAVLARAAGESVT